MLTQPSEPVAAFSQRSRLRARAVADDVVDGCVTLGLVVLMALTGLACAIATARFATGAVVSSGQMLVGLGAAGAAAVSFVLWRLALKLAASAGGDE